MAQVTVEQLAETVGASVDRLLSQMKDAGLPHAAADEAVSEEDKQTLLTHLKKSHGERAGAPKKITLKRKSVSTLRAGGAGKRTVNVEVRTASSLRATVLIWHGRRSSARRAPIGAAQLRVAGEPNRFYRGQAQLSTRFAQVRQEGGQ